MRDLFLTGLQGLYGVIPELKSCRVLRGMEGSVGKICHSEITYVDLHAFFL